MTCVTESTALGWVGDGLCDDGSWGYDLTCDAFDFDGGDCEEDPGFGIGDSCGEGQIYDCSMTCVWTNTATSYRGDAVCDDGTWGYDLDCSSFDFDDGDCTGAEPTPGDEHAEGQIYDCDMTCVSESLVTSWLGDGECDELSYGEPQL